MEGFKNEEILNQVDENHRGALEQGKSVSDLAVRLLNIQQGDLVFCPSLNSSIVCDEIIGEGAEPVFIDSEYNSLNMSIVALKKAFKYYSEIGRLPKGVVISNIYNQSVNIDELVNICDKYKVPLIEDTKILASEDLDKKVEKKKYIYEYYEEALKDIDEIKMQNNIDYGKSNYYVSIAILSTESNVKPTDIISALKEENVEAKYICKPMHIQDIYKNYNFFSSYSYHGISVAEEVFSRGVCLPSDINMCDKDLDKIISVIKIFF